MIETLAGRRLRIDEDRACTISISANEYIRHILSPIIGICCVTRKILSRQSIIINEIAVFWDSYFIICLTIETLAGSRLRIDKGRACSLISISANEYIRHIGDMHDTNLTLKHSAGYQIPLRRFHLI